jgi:hypothetical protein
MNRTAMSAVARTILPFPCGASSGRGRTLRKDLLAALRLSPSPVIVDVSGCCPLNQEDVDLLLDCVAQAAGRDTQVLFVAGSLANRVLLEVTRISSVAPVFNSVTEALGYPQTPAENDAKENETRDQPVSEFKNRWSA